MRLFVCCCVFFNFISQRIYECWRLSVLKIFINYFLLCNWVGFVVYVVLSSVANVLLEELQEDFYKSNDVVMLGLATTFYSFSLLLSRDELALR